MKRCPTCGRELEDSAEACGTCEAWAAALVEAPLAAAETTPAVPVDASPVAVERTPNDFLDFSLSDADESAPVPQVDVPAAVAEIAPAASQPQATVAPTATAEHVARRREMTLAAVAVAGVALVGVILLFARSGPTSEVAAAPATARPAAPRPAAPRAAAGSAVAPVAEASTATQRWSTENATHWLGANRRGAAFELPAENIVSTWFGPIRPSLVVRCMGRSMQAFVYTGSPLRIEPQAEGKTITVSIDGQPPTTEHWPDSDDHDALFAPDGAGFATRLTRARSLRVGYSPHNANDVVAEFRVSGLEALMERSAKECGWTK